MKIIGNIGNIKVHRIECTCHPKPPPAPSALSSCLA